MSIAKAINLYIKHQKSYFLLLILLFVLPLALFLQFSPYELPKVQYVFLGLLVASQYGFYREKDFRRKIKSNVREILNSELKRIPSQKEVHLRSSLVVRFRGLSIIFTALCIFGLMIYFQEF